MRTKMTRLRKYMNYKYVKYMVYILYFLYFIYKKYMKTVLKSVLFVGILIFLINATKIILSEPIGTNTANQAGISELHKYPNSYDVCFLGTSTTITNICNQELFENYGIAGLTIGEPEQALYLTKYTLEEMFEYQSPQVVFVDTKSLFYSLDTLESMAVEREDYTIHNSIDGIKTLSIKNKALDRVKNYNKNIDKWNYFSKLYYSHENWKNLGERNFKNYDISDSMNGNLALLGTADYITNIYDKSNTDVEISISLQSERDFSEIVDLCKKNKTDLILITGYTNFSKAMHKSCLQLAKKYKIPYIDINQFTIKSNFQHSVDLYDSVHFNLSGAIKFTNLLGEYLEKNYTFSDKRNLSTYERYKKQTNTFQGQKNFINTQHSLISAYSFYRYLLELQKVDLNNNIIFISAYNDAFEHITKKENELLQNLGIKTNLLNKKGCSYAAVLSKKSIKENYSYLDLVTLEGKINDTVYEVQSNGTDNKDRTSIIVNDTELIQAGPGINVVVYNTQFEKVVNACFFNTCSAVNPLQSKYKASTETRARYTTGSNIWEYVE